VIEVRPVLPGDPGTGWGIRSRFFRLSDNSYLKATAPRVLVTPSLLAVFTVVREEPLPGSRAKAFKTWLGRRYDRPAVPPEFVELAKEIATAVRSTRTNTRADACHDVLMSFTPGDPPRFALLAVIADPAEEGEVAEWMAQAALQVPANVGVMAVPPTAVPKTRLSLTVVEDSYSADLSDITWGKHDARGAT
jgi:hypothetical protein